MKDEEKEEENSGKSGTHKDNDLSNTEKVLKDNDMPQYQKEKDKEEDDGAES